MYEKINRKKIKLKNVSILSQHKNIDLALWKKCLLVEIVYCYLEYTSIVSIRLPSVYLFYKHY